ncbi:MAG: 2,3-bisphosphoglycerate-dependent phosphoglycerate mutase [Euryarchaeota archaeon UBA443]|nr:MAG: 2,3-bisphosphoglycerate-dependent phosphoglycerate mutase [Euryarchaeota archaeon UBA443]
MASLILIRHGQSMWNAANLFTGWVDVPLTQVGIDEGGNVVEAHYCKDTADHIPLDRMIAFSNGA